MKLSGQIVSFHWRFCHFSVSVDQLFLVIILQLANKFITATACVIALHLRSQSDFLFGLLLINRHIHMLTSGTD